MDEMTGRINILAESHPELKSSANSKQLRISISEVEEGLQAARRICNMNVSRLNQPLASWPASVVGSMKRHAPKQFFKVEEQKKSDVMMDF